MRRGDPEAIAWGAKRYHGAGGPLTDLGILPGGDCSFGFVVNASGQVVGDATIAGGAGHAFLDSGGQMVDLNDLIAPGSGWTLTDAFSISDTGYITGDGLAPNGQADAFLLTPLALVPEPSGLVLLATGAVALPGYHGARRRARNRAGRRG
jgi:probable HAF family extracellular repeat protein